MVAQDCHMQIMKPLAPECHKNDTENFKDTYGRMWWDKPSPTITTKFFSISNGRFAHPEENRAISLEKVQFYNHSPKIIFLNQLVLPIQQE
jgi:DNA (cytosine-5)-methyltransferase 1